jgi:type I site-specific restriction-modification system R (restriction) subunit
MKLTQRDYIEKLFEDLEELADASHWLKRSYGICQDVGIKPKYREDEFDAFETLTSRFARLSDMLIQKIFRSIDKIEFTEDGTLLDALNRSHKRGLITSIDEVRAMRELRNAISHEYTPRELKELFEDTLKYSALLLEIIERVNRCSEKYQERIQDLGT